MNSWESSPILCVPRLKSNAESISNLLDRWNLYAEKLSEISNRQARGLRLFAFEDDLGDLGDYSHLKIEKVNGKLGSVKSFFNFLLFTVKGIQAQSNTSVTLICGDPYYSTSIGLITKFVSAKKIFLQTQIHGDIYSGWGMKSIFVRYSLRKSDSIRVVSNLQKKFLQNEYPYLANKIFVAPIPINYSKIASGCNVVEPRILFLGRLQDERGIQDAMEILAQLNALDFQVTIAGDGPAKPFVLQRVGDFQMKDKVQVLDSMDIQGVKSLYEKHRFLLSTAPKEGYGLVLREASLSGLKVFAKKSEGSVEAQRDFPNSICIFDSTDMAVSMIQAEYLSSTPQDPNCSDRQAQELRDEQSIITLCTTWICHL